MQIGAITGYFDVAQLTLYAFWIFFAGLILYLRREDKREGYPLDANRAGVVVQGYPDVPAPKVFHRLGGRVTLAPRKEPPSPPLNARPVAPWHGAPLQPLGNPMVDGIGPAAWAMRSDEPEVTHESGLPRIAPLRLFANRILESKDPELRGMAVLGFDNLQAGTVTDVWLDRSEATIRYLEVELTGGRHVLLPMTFATLRVSRREVRVKSILSTQFALVPELRHPDQVSLREEDRITAYYGSGHLYATPQRLGPLL